MDIFQWVWEHFFLQDTFGRLLLISRNADIKTFNSKQIFSLDQYCWHATFDEQKRRFSFLASIRFEKHKPSWCFQGFHFIVELLLEQFLAWKI